VDLERCKKDAKALLRAHRNGDAEALVRAQRVLGDRERFQLSDAQHVIAVELGFRTWPELTRVERLIETGLEYLPGDPVVLRATQRRHLYIDDQGGAVARAGEPPRALREQLADELIVNIGRNGTVSLPVMCGNYDEVVARIADASLALYQELLELSSRP
jgi:hypothetical protein